MRKTNQQRINLRRQTAYDDAFYHLSEFIDAFGDLPNVAKHELLRSVRSFYNYYVYHHYFTLPEDLSNILTDIEKK